MPRLITKVPSYRLHRQSGQAIVTLQGRDHLLGPHGSDTSRAKYDRLIGEWLARGRQPEVTSESGLTIEELAARYWTYAEVRFVRNGKPTADQFKVKTALAPLVRLYRDLLADEFGPLQLKVVRGEFIKLGWARSYVNEQVGVSAVFSSGP